MSGPSVAFLCECIATALLAHYGVEKPPVPVEDFLRAPPRDLARDLSLTEALPFGEALWLRLPSGQGTVFVNPALPEPRWRYAMAGAFFVALCSSPGGQAAGLPSVPNDDLQAQAACFARRLLMPEHLLPAGWQSMSSEALAELFVIPTSVVEARLCELAGRPPVTTMADLDPICEAVGDRASTSETSLR